MNIKIICVGKIKEKFYTEAISEYLKRLSKFHKIEITEIEEEKIQNDEKKVITIEGKKIIDKLYGFVIALDKSGQVFDSIEFAENLNKLTLNNSTISFVIGGSYGLSDDVKRRANLLLSFSKFTFPHQLFRVILLEQIYRATTINNNITYHK